jgi:hypothetical protein
MAKNDTRIKQSFESKTLGGYISIENLEENEDIEFKYNMIYDNMGILQNGEEIWMKRLEEVKKYIDENDKRPKGYEKNIQIKKLGHWTNSQQIKYKKKEFIVKNEEIYNKWTEFINDDKYKKYFISNEEKWINILEEIKQYIHTNNKLPSRSDEIIQIKKLGYWIKSQRVNYKKKKEIMLNEKIYNSWTLFINDPKYEKYFLSNEDAWNKLLEEVKKYMDENNKRPSLIDKDDKIKKSAEWLGTQSKNYNKKENIMKNEEIYNKWTEFITSEKYKKYFMSNEEKWFYNLNNIKKYIDTNNKRPIKENKDIEIKQLGQWISTQQDSYKKKDQIMKTDYIYDEWTVFINSEKYKKYFMSNEDAWNESLNDLKKYINENDKLPSSTDKDKQIKILNSWVANQKINYKSKKNIMKNEKIYNKWTRFINNSIYKNYF